MYSYSMLTIVSVSIAILIFYDFFYLNVYDYNRKNNQK